MTFINKLRKGFSYAWENFGTPIFIILFFGFRGYILDFAIVPSESLTNTLCNGDWVIINRFVYARPTLLMIPFLGRSLGWLEQDKIETIKNLKRGDIVAFFHGARYFTKRVIGLPGDTVEIIGKSDGTQEVIVNGERTIFREDGKPIFPEGRFKFTHDDGTTEDAMQLKSMLKVSDDKYVFFNVTFSKRSKGKAKKYRLKYVVQPGYFFGMGDNRNDSFDSRFFYFGPIELNAITGKVIAVIIGSSAMFAPSSTWLQTKAGQNLKNPNYKFILAWGQFFVELPYTIVKRFIKAKPGRFNLKLYDYKTKKEIFELMNKAPVAEQKDTNSKADAKDVEEYFDRDELQNILV